MTVALAGPDTYHTTDDLTAKAIQLYTEHDSQVPFDTGSVAKPPAEVLERARTLGEPVLCSLSISETLIP